MSPSRGKQSVISWTANALPPQEATFLLHFIAAFQWFGHHADLSQITAFLTQRLKMIKNNSFPLITHIGRKTKMSLENYYRIKV